MSSHNFLKSVVLFQDLSETSLDKIEKLSAVRNYKKGDEIIAEKEVAKEFFVVGKGSVSINRQLAGGWKKKLAVLEQSQVFGEAILFDEGPSYTVAEAQEDTTIVAFSQVDFRNLLDQDPEIALPVQKQIIKRMSSRLREAEERNQEDKVWGMEDGTSL